MGMVVTAGRDFDERDTMNSQKVAIVSANLAQQLWPGSDPIGRVFTVLNNFSSRKDKAEWYELVGVVMTGAPYKGSAPAISDTIGGQTQFMFPSLFTALPHVKSGKLRALAVAGPKRSALLPDVPTLKEAGVDGVDVQQWYGLFAPAKTPKPIIDQINKALNQVLADKDVVKRMEDHGADVETSTPEQFGSLVKSELVKWKSVVQRAKLTAD
jgi:hypothetical protein